MPVRLDAILFVYIAKLVAFVVECDAIELFEWIWGFLAWRSETGVKRYTLHFSCRDIDGGTLFDIAEVDSVNAPALMWDDWWLHVSKQCPLRSLEEWMCFHV